MARKKDREVIWKEFQEKASLLEKKYLENMETLRNLPRSIDEEQRIKHGDEIIDTIEAKMAELGEQFCKKMDALADEFTSQMEALELG